MARRYTSTVRAEAQAATRKRILAAATRLFDEHGYGGTTMAAIATEAGVSVQSVHLAGPKSALLVAAFEAAVAGDERLAPSGRQRAAALLELPPSEAMRAYAHVVGEANRASAGVWRALLSAARDDDELHALVDDVKARRDGDIQRVISWADTHGLLTGAATLSQRRDVLTWLVSPETFDFLVRESGWSMERYERWIADGIRTNVLDAQ